MEKKSPDAFRTISEVAEWLGVPTHVLRFWESRFSQVKPVKRAGGRRYYRPNDMELLGGIRKLLHEDGMTIRGVQKLLREEGIKHVAAMSPPLDSDEMRDITPSNVVSLNSGSAKDDSTAADDAKPAAAPAPETHTTVDDTSSVQSDEHTETKPSDDATDVSNDMPQDAATPSFGSSRPAETADSPVTADASNPELPGLGAQDDTPESAAPRTDGTSEEQVDAPAPQPLKPIDVSHIPADPDDLALSVAQSQIIPLRSARKSGGIVETAPLKSIVERLKALAQRMQHNAGSDT